MSGTMGTGLHFEEDVLVFFKGLRFYLLCEPDYWLEMNIGLFFLL